MEQSGPSSSYVRDTYNELVGGQAAGYTHYRWQQSPVSRYHYRQSKRTLERAIRFLPKKITRALEIGGGDGAWTPYIAERADRMDFLDISKEMLSQAKRALSRFPAITYIEGDFLQWKSESESYGAILSIRNIEYMNDKEAVVRTFATALQSGGILIVSTKNPAFDWGGYFGGKELHSGQITRGHLLHLLRRYGFQIRAVYPAIIGKLIRLAPVRIFFDLLHTIALRIPGAAVLLSWVSESYLVVAEKA